MHEFGALTNKTTKVLSVILAASVLMWHPISVWAAPKIATNPESFDFGYLPEGQIVACQYWLVNRGDDTLVIEMVKPQCGCTTVPLPTDRLAPSDSVLLHLSFDSKNMKGRINKAVRIWSNDSTLNPATLYFTGAVADSSQTMIADPPFASLVAIDNPHQIIELTNTSQRPYKVGLAAPAPPFITCEFSSDSVAAGGRVTLKIVPGQGTPLGEYKTSITLQCEGSLSFPLTIPIKGVGYMQ